MFKDLVLKNRSYRGYDRNRRITREEALELVDLTRYTPSSLNHQPLKYFVATDEGTVAKVQAQTVWAKGLPALNLPYPGTEPTAFIVICIDKSLINGQVVYLRDVGIAAQTILLGATEKGLGGCMIGSFYAGKLKEALGLPENIEPNLVIALGKPAEEIIITEIKDGKTNYSRDESGKVHYVPKRLLDEIVL